MESGIIIRDMELHSVINGIMCRAAEMKWNWITGISETTEKTDENK